MPSDQFHTDFFWYNTLCLWRTWMIMFWRCAKGYLGWERLREWPWKPLIRCFLNYTYALFFDLIIQVTNKCLACPFLLGQGIELIIEIQFYSRNTAFFMICPLEDMCRCRGFGECWGFPQTAAAATISMGWRCWSFIKGGWWFKQSAGSGRSSKIQAYPCHHPTPWIHTKQFGLGDMLAYLGPCHQVSSCYVVGPSQSWGFSSDLTHRFLIFSVRTWNTSGATGAQT